MLFKYYNRLRTPQSQKIDIPLRTAKTLDAIGNERRRAVIIELATRETPITLSVLSESLAADECGVHPDKLNAQARKRVYVSLYQRHLPRLTDLGAVSYDERDGKVGMSDATVPLAQLIDEIEERCLTVE